MARRPLAAVPPDEGEHLRYAGYALYRCSAEAMACRAAVDDLFTWDGDTPGNGPGTGQTNAVVCCGDLNNEPRQTSPQSRSSQRARCRP